jgi:membrane protein DedA with SNARE-associated domain
MPFDLRALADSIGYPSAGLGILVESTGIPFPGETTLLAVAAYAAAGHLDIRVVILVAALGATLGGDLGYLIGYRGGRPFVERFSHRIRLNAGHLARSEMFFTRYGAATILFARFALGLRTWASVLAGMARMPFWTFQLYSMVGAVAWAIVIGVVGYYLGSNWALVQTLAHDLGLGGLAALAVVILAFVLLRRRATSTWP